MIKSVPPAGLFKSLQTMVKTQALSIIHNSLDDFFSLFQAKPQSVDLSHYAPPSAKPPRFSVMLNFVKKSQVIEFDPPLSDIEEALAECLTFFVSTMDSIPHFEKTLVLALKEESSGFNPFENSKENSILINEMEHCSVTVEQKRVQEITDYLKKYAVDCFALASEYLQRYNKYIDLFSSQLSKDISQFLEEEHTFEEYARKENK